MRTRTFVSCVLMLALVVIGSRAARAQSTLEVPGPANQNQPYVAPRATPFPFIRLAPSGSDNGDSGNTIQLLPNWNQSAQPQAAATPQSPPPAHVNVAPMTAQAAPVLPAVFRGCWQGEVNQLEWIRRAPGAPKIGYWTPKTYKLCYKRVGNQPFTLTFTNTGIEESDKIVNAHGKVTPLSTDGRAYALMRSNLSFDEYKVRPDGIAPTFAVKEVTNLDCRIAGNDMMVTADVLGARDGAPWFSARWRADFHRYED